MDQDLVECNRNRIAVTENDVSQTIPNQNHVNPGFVDDSRGWIVVGCEAYKTLSTILA